MQFEEEEELIQVCREWRELTDEQKKYLIQVRPPGDLLPSIIRDLALASNITNAGILYDKTFGEHRNITVFL